MERQLPQLEMVLFLDSFVQRDPIDLPGSLEFVEKNDPEAWLAIINESFGFEFEEQDFKSEMNLVLNGKKSQLIFVKDEVQGLIATGSIIIKNQIGELHYIAARENFRGKGLGLKVSAKLIQNAINLGVSVIKLHTDDYRVPAIKTYFKLRFTPNIVHSNQIKRWEKIIEENNLNF